MTVAVEYLAIGRDQAIVADGNPLISMDTSAMYPAIFTNDDLSARSISEKFTRAEHIQMIAEISRVNQRPVANPERCSGTDINHGKSFEANTMTYFDAGRQHNPDGHHEMIST